MVVQHNLTAMNVSPAIVVTTDLADLFHFKSEHTAKNYVKYLKEAYMLVGIQKYSQKSKQRSVQEKVYAVDVAMMDQRENAFAGENLGHRLETIVAIHLVRKCKSEGLDVYYLNSQAGLWANMWHCKMHISRLTRHFCNQPPTTTTR